MERLSEEAEVDIDLKGILTLNNLEKNNKNGGHILIHRSSQT